MTSSNSNTRPIYREKAALCPPSLEPVPPELVCNDDFEAGKEWLKRNIDFASFPIYQDTLHRTREREIYQDSTCRKIFDVRDKIDSRALNFFSLLWVVGVLPVTIATALTGGLFVNSLGEGGSTVATILGWFGGNMGIMLTMICINNLASSSLCAFRSKKIERQYEYYVQAVEEPEKQKGREEKTAQQAESRRMRAERIAGFIAPIQEKGARALAFVATLLTVVQSKLGGRKQAPQPERLRVDPSLESPTPQAAPSASSRKRVEDIVTVSAASRVTTSAVAGENLEAEREAQAENAATAEAPAPKRQAPGRHFVATSGQAPSAPRLRKN